MKKVFLILTFLVLLINNSFAQTIERDQVNEKHKWNLSDIYPSTAVWQADVDMLKNEVEKLADFKGKLGSSAESLYNALKVSSGLLKHYGRHGLMQVI